MKRKRIDSGSHTLVVAMEHSQQQEQEENMAVEQHDEPLDYDDDTPAFVRPDEAVEVEIGDDDVPMEDDEDDDEAVDAQDQQQHDVVVEDVSDLQLSTHTGPIYALAAHPTPQGLVIVSGGGDDAAFLHHIRAEPTSIRLSHAHKDSVAAVALNLAYIGDDLTKTPPMLAVGGYDGAIIVYHPETGEKIRQLEGPTDVEWLAFHPKGGTVLLAGSSSDSTIWMWNLVLDGRCLQVFVGHEASITAGAFTADGRWAVSASTDGTCRVWAPRTGAARHVFRWSEAGLTCLAVGGGVDQQLVMVGAEDGQAHVCHVGNKKVVASLRHYEVPTMDEDDQVDLPMSVEAVGFSPASPHWCATGGVDGALKIWDLTSGQCRQVCRPAQAGDAVAPGITRLQWHPTHPVVFTSHTNGSVCLTDARNGQVLATLTGNADVVNDLAIAYIGSKAAIVTGGDDQTLRLFEIDVDEALQVANK